MKLVCKEPRKRKAIITVKNRNAAMMWKHGEIVERECSAVAEAGVRP